MAAVNALTVLVVEDDRLVREDIVLLGAPARRMDRVGGRYGCRRAQGAPGNQDC